MAIRPLSYFVLSPLVAVISYFTVLQLTEHSPPPLLCFMSGPGGGGGHSASPRMPGTPSRDPLARVCCQTSRAWPADSPDVKDKFVHSCLLPHHRSPFHGYAILDSPPKGPETVQVMYPF